MKKIDRLNYKAQAHKLNSSVLIGKAGLSKSVIDEINAQLKAHKLIKVKVSSNDRMYRNQIQEKICKITNSVVIDKIGKILIIFKEDLS